MKSLRIFTSVLLSTVMTCGVYCVPVHGEQAYDEEVNEENTLALLKAYDPEGWDIVSFNIREGNASIEDWLIYADSNADGLGTVMHEEYHTYTFYRNPYYIVEDGIYIGSETIRLTDGQEFHIPYRNPDNTMYITETYARTIPEELRTFRYDTYVSEGAADVSNKSGIYGLLNEYSAYSWGFHTDLRLYPYFAANDNFLDFYNDCINDYQAYAEFRFWTLGLLNYERQYAPEYYEEHMNNILWINAYCGTTMQFRDMIDTFEAYCAVMSDTKSWKPYSERLPEDREKRGIPMLQEASSAPELSAIEQELFRRCTITFQSTGKSCSKQTKRIPSPRHYDR